MEKRRTHDAVRPRPAGRILSAGALAKVCERYRRQGLRVVFTNGVFDVLHRGHLDLLNKARGYGDVLIVGLNSDRSVRRLKGAGRPVNRQQDRAAVLAALRSVDYVCLFSADTPRQLIRTLRPDVLVKGSEYEAGSIVGAEDIRNWGGTVKRVTMRPGYSTTASIRRLASNRG